MKKQVKAAEVVSELPSYSPDQRTLARELSDHLIEAVRENAHSARIDLGGAKVADGLRQLRDLVWPDSQGSETLGDREALRGQMQAVLSGMESPKAQTQLLEAYARMGHLYEIAGLSARDGLFQHLKRNHQPVPGGAQEFVDSRKESLAQTIEALNKPVFEVTMTQHPTNINSLASIKKQREIGRLIHSKDARELKEAIRAYAEEPLLQQEAGRDVNFTVRDETQMVLHYLNNLYDDLPAAYREYDNALAQKASRTRETYDPLALNLQLRIGSWGSSGDKDGNNNVSADTTLEAIALHRQAILTRYAEDLGEICEKAAPSATTTALRTQLQEIIKNKTIADGIAHTFEQKWEKQKYPSLTPKEFDDISALLASTAFDAKKLEKTLEEAARTPALMNVRQPLIDLTRRVRIFGDRFAKIEYRETADVYERVVDVLLPKYAGASKQEKISRLKTVLEKGAAAELYQAAKDHIHQGACRPYSLHDPLPIAYHSFKRMELARDHAGMIQDHVLAECQGAHNIMELLLLQRAVTGTNGRRAMLGEIPLFEEKDTISNVRGIMEDVLKEPAYLAHLKELAQARGYSGDVPQQIQIAHSDNARRISLPGARAYIHEAHAKYRELIGVLNENKNVRDALGGMALKAQFFEGGSISDAYRNGVRAVSASVNAFRLHDFAKFTFQGGDLLNYFNQTGSIVRMLTRHFTHQAEALAGGAAQGNGKYRVDVPKNMAAISALKQAYDDYDKEFTTERMGTLLAALDYDRETKAGNRGSRAAARAGFASAKTEVGAVVPIDVKRVRTIAFSEGAQHMAIVPSFFGMNEFEKHLSEAMGEPLTPKLIKELYDHAPVFKDVIDRVAYGAAYTDLWTNLNANPNITRIETPEDKGGAKVILGKNAFDRKNFSDYVNDINKAYRVTATLAHQALTGLGNNRVSSSHVERIGKGEQTDITTMLMDDLERIRPIMADKTRYREFLIEAKRSVLAPENQAKAGFDEEAYGHARGVVHAGIDTVVHGRVLEADDPRYGQFRSKNGGIKIAQAGSSYMGVG